MQKRKLGRSDVKVSTVIFGAWAIGGWMWGGSDDAEAISAIHASIEAGADTIDTAAIYGQGHSEMVVGKAIAGRRDKVVIATKCGRRWDSDQGSDPFEAKDLHGKPITIRSNSRPESIAKECEDSLGRLGTDVIDIYQIHWPDKTTAIEDSMAVLMKLKSQGKIRAIGVSNFEVEWMSRAVKVGQLDSLQPPYSVVRRGIEKDVIPFCRGHEVGVICYSPMERGLLTGAVTMERVFPPGDHRTGHVMFKPENRKLVIDGLDKIKPMAQSHGISLAQLIIAWTIEQPGITAALVGARNAEQATHNAGAMDVVLSKHELDEITAAFEPAIAKLPV